MQNLCEQRDLTRENGVSVDTFAETIKGLTLSYDDLCVESPPDRAKAVLMLNVRNQLAEIAAQENKMKKGND